MQSKSISVIPESVFTLLRAVIRKRKECAQWYRIHQSSTDQLTRNDHEGHRHSIDVLEQLLKILEPKRAKPRATTSTSAKPSKTNAYDNLEVEESFDLDRIIHKVQSSTQSQNVQYEPDADAEVSFGVYCLLRDMETLSLYVRRTWREIMCGSIALQTASMVTNTACAMLKRANDELVREFPRFEGTTEATMWYKLYHFLSLDRTEKERSVKPQSVDSNHPGASRFIVDATLQNPSVAMCSHVVLLVNSVARTSVNADWIITADEERFAKTVSQLTTMPQEFNPYFEGCIIHQAINSWSFKPNLELWQVYSAQILWDIQRELGNDLSLPKTMLEIAVRDIVTRYNQYLKLDDFKALGGFCDAPRNHATITSRTLQADILDGGLQKLIDDSEASLALRDIKIPGFSLFHCHPSLCGLVLLNVYDICHRNDVDMASEQGMILSAAHLYNATEQLGRIPADVHWEDLEAFIEKQGAAWMFVGKKPDKKSDFARRLHIVLGQKTTDIMKARRTEDSKYFEGSKVYRRFEYATKLLELRVNRDKDTTKAKSKLISPEFTNANTNPLGMATWLVENGMTTEEEATLLSPIQTLTRLKQAVERDVPGYAFDFLGLYIRCYFLLQRFSQYCMSQASLDFRPDEFGGELGFNYLIIHFFNYLCGVKHYQDDMFPVAIDMLKKVTEEDGDAAKTEMDRMTQVFYNQDPVQVPEGDFDTFEVPIEDKIPFTDRADLDLLVDKRKHFRIPRDISEMAGMTMAMRQQFVKYFTTGPPAS